MLWVFARSYRRGQFSGKLLLLHFQGPGFQPSRLGKFLLSLRLLPALQISLPELEVKLGVIRMEL